EKGEREGEPGVGKSWRGLGGVHPLAGDPPLRRRPSGFKGLVRVVTAQQLSVASAEAIWRRLEAAVEPFTPSRFLSVSENDLRAAGLSKVKIATLRGLAEATATGSLSLDAPSPAPEDVSHTTLPTLT